MYLDLGDETNGIKHANAALKGVNLMNTAVYTADFCEVNSETLWAFECPTDDNQFYLSLPSFWYLCGDDYEDAVIGYSSLRVSKALINLMEDKDIRKTQFPKDSEINDYISETGYLTTKIHSRNNEMGQGSFNMLRGSEMYLLNSTCKCNRILINNLFKFFVWREVSKSFTRSIIEFIFNPLNLFVGYFTKVLTLWDILPDKPVGVFIGTTFP